MSTERQYLCKNVEQNNVLCPYLCPIFFILSKWLYYFCIERCAPFTYTGSIA